MELDKKIEGILLQRLVAIIQVWCSDFDRTDDGDARRDIAIPARDASGKRRGGKGAKEEKVCFSFACKMINLNYSSVHGSSHGCETYSARN